jgi:hypothetical protein
MQSKNKAVILVGATMLISLAGCGTDKKEGAVETKTASYAASAACIACHTTKQSPVTGNYIASEWVASAHNTKNGATCRDCHDPSNLSEHPVGAIATTNPLDTVCVTCHTKTTMRTGEAHFVGYTTNRAQAAYLNSTDTNKCRTCHNPHDMTSLMAVNKAWAASGHGDTKSMAFYEDPWRSYSSGACARCHTTTGYVYYNTNNLTAVPKATFGKYTTAHEVIGCGACHSDYSWARRTASFVTFSTPYRTTSGISRTFPTIAADIGDSKLCIPCHAARESGESVKLLASSSTPSTADYTNVSFKNPHYLAAAGVFYQKAGYHYLAASKYTNTASGSSPQGWNHGNIGINNFVTSGGQATGSNGPCVTCHLRGGHGFSAIATAQTTGTTGCFGCHGSEDIPTLIEEEKALFDRGMDFFAYTLAQNNMFYTESYPYFMTAATAGTAIKNWTQSATLPVGPAAGAMVSGSSNMGAAFNYKLLTAEKGAHVHNRAYARKLIQDSIAYLQNGNVPDRVTSSPYTLTTISFTSYSTAHPTGTISITQLKDWLHRRVNADGTTNSSGLFWGFR